MMLYVFGIRWKIYETLECKYEHSIPASDADSKQTLGQFNSRYYISFDWGFLSTLLFNAAASGFFCNAKSCTER